MHIVFNSYAGATTLAYFFHRKSAVNQLLSDNKATVIKKISYGNVVKCLVPYTKTQSQLLNKSSQFVSEMHGFG